MIKPARLAKGDAIGIISPSDPSAAECPQRLARAVIALQALGFGVVLAPHARARRGYTAGSIRERVSDVHEMFQDSRIKAIISTVGGLSSNQLLDELDYEVIRRYPKILMGYSDVTALLLAVQTKTGLVTFLGPALMPQFGECGGPHSYTVAMMERVLMSARVPIALRPSHCQVSEELRWDLEDCRPPRIERCPAPRVVRPGLARGRIVAGNLSTLLLLAGTGFWPRLEGAILGVEEDGSESPASIDRMLTQLRQMGAFEGLAGLIVGRYNPATPDEGGSLADVLLSVTRGYEMPIASGLDFGHTDPMSTLPNGILAELECGPRVRLRLLESAVVASPAHGPRRKRRC